MTKPCPGDGQRGCLVMIPARRDRCRFCARTMQLRAAAAKAP